MTVTIPELVDRFIKGDQEAFAELVRRYQKKIYSLAFHLLGNHLDADEVVQETFVRVYKRRNELERIKYFSNFLLKIATNYAIDLLRRRKGHTGISSEAISLPGSVQLDLARHVATPGEQYENKELMEEILKALDQLPPRQRMTAILHDVEGYSVAEIAQSFGNSEATVRSNLHIARRKLKIILKLRLEGEEK